MSLAPGRGSCSQTGAARRGLRFVAGCRWGALCAMGNVGVLAATWAWLLPPTRPGTFLILGDTPRPPAEGDSPSALPLLKAGDSQVTPMLLNESLGA
jgi:hypothetical protein